MGLLDNIKKEEGTNSPVQKVQVVTPSEPQGETLDQKRARWYTTLNQSYTTKRVCMVLGEDGVGKTGLVLNEVIKWLDKNPEKKVFVLDIDDGIRPLMKYYTKYAERIIVFNPLNLSEEDKVKRINYLKTVSEIREVVNDIADNFKELNIGVFVLDGLTTLLSWCSDQMREDKHLTPDGAFNMKYWTIRNKYFLETLSAIKLMPFDTYFIGHDNFIPVEQEVIIQGVPVKLGNLQKKTNAMIYQRILCSKSTNDKGEFILKAKIDKSKGAPLKEGKEYVFMKISNNEIMFDSKNVFEGF